MRLREANHAGEAAVYGSLKVIGDVKSKNVRRIERNVDMIQQETHLAKSEVANYWAKLSADGIITPLEKKMLKKEFESISQSYAALYYQASERGLAGTDWWNDYAQTYEDFRKYIYVTLALFDDMEASTILSNREEFNEYFASYYYAEKMTHTRITSNLNDDYFVKVLTSFDEVGTEGEIRVWHGRFYQYTNGKWIKQGGEYLGVFENIADELLYVQEGQYFLSSGSFSISEPLYTNGDVLYVNGEWLFVSGARVDCEVLNSNGEPLYTNGELLYTYGTPQANDFQFTANKVYYYENAGWHEAADDDWRYFTCMADYSNLTGHFPRVVQNEIIDVVDESGKFNPVGERYLGILSTVPQNVRDGQFFVYSGTNHTAAGVNWQYSKIYKYEEGRNPAWQFLDATQPQNQEYYMSCLEDVLSLHDITDGYFAVLFAQSFFGNQAALNSLSVRTIILDTNGSINSKQTEYISHTRGLRIDANGNIDANGVTHIGKQTGTDPDEVSLSIDGKTSIGGNCIIGGSLSISGTTEVSGDFKSSNYLENNRGYRLKTDGSMEINSGIFRGELSGASGTFSGALSGATGTFSGALSAASGTFKGTIETDGLFLKDSLSIPGNYLASSLAADIISKVGQNKKRICIGSFFIAAGSGQYQCTPCKFETGTDSVTFYGTGLGFMNNKLNIGPSEESLLIEGGYLVF